MRSADAETPNDPVGLLVKMTVWSPEGQQAILNAAKAGLSAADPIEALVRRTFSGTYLRSSARLRGMVATEVAQVLSRLGYAE